MKATLRKAVFPFLFLALPVLALAQGTISGTITEAATGQPLPGVNVIVKGTANGTTADFDGNFQINVTGFPVTLVFSSLGYGTKEQTITGPSTVNVALAETATGLDEVVVTGLATSIKRENLANAVASVSAAELAGITPPQTLDGALAGKFAGALITKSSGAPGGGISVRLRGVTSVNGNSQPLYIVDGVYVNNSSIAAPGLNAVSGAAAGGNASNQDNPSNRIADINSDDIESVEILKGAAAAAIYGARAAAGVIIITTKKGEAGKTKVSFSQAFGFNEVIRLRGLRNFTPEIAEAGFGAGQGALFTAAQNNGSLIDYEKEIFGEEGFISNSNVNISGGSDNTLFYGGFSNNEEEGIVKGTGYNRKSIRLNLDHRFWGDRAKLSLNTNYVNSSADRGFFNNDNSGTTIGVALTSTPPWA
ncbi:carboxypeptidase-like regulatory domain-containing protein [Arenibacter sp. GZD96]|uniref:carboxypeptidase-like regulatory domain-containing protein n=1 Tax=Aurantibrevibacter litoralis TaxID=3106030 RepID=UPI002AFDE296|nr:carboxypeptidase-like regulatory domain-containing protein [Arenibacter sp. GZD-96]MEA1786646.1 carboxypeptidase-like regulatory domain-containing protein [Arenibacter sp. GZD-96]